MPYVEDPLQERDSSEIRTSVQHLEVSPEEAGQRLDKFVSKRLGDVPRSRIYRVIRKGEVRVNGRRADPATRLNALDKIRLPPVRVLPAATPRTPAANLLSRVGQAVIYEDRHLLVLDKPAGIAVHGGSGVSAGIIEALRALRPEESLELVHRLDRDTSGCLLVARDAPTLRTLHALLREEGFEKRYLALLKGKWDLGEKRIAVPLRTDTRLGGERTVRADASGKPSTSRFRPVQFFGRIATLVEVSLDTGRTHQIRVHAAHAGHPVAGDEKYGDEAFNASLRALGLTRMFLHASSVGFNWPQGGPFSVNTPLPPELATVLEKLATAEQAPRRAAPRRAR
ncbi:MAG TPA: RluA family pseudouridine synthase [Steroidobacteraceae bacterium]|nr:RluA family pseudouridine synthase [Steroidobacteraceae bacterium]